MLQAVQFVHDHSKISFFYTFFLERNVKEVLCFIGS